MKFLAASTFSLVVLERVSSLDLSAICKIKYGVVN